MFSVSVASHTWTAEEDHEMSVRERRNRKDRQAKTPEQLHRGRCGICMGRIRRGQETREVPVGSGRAHLVCPDWRWWLL